jgi:hypothetical protein
MNDLDASNKMHRTSLILPHIQQQYSSIANSSNSNLKQMNTSSTNTTVNSAATPSSTVSISSITLSKNNLNSTQMNGISESNFYVKPSASLHVIHSEEDFDRNDAKISNNNNPFQINNLAVKTPGSSQING